jgi:dolichol kinase
MSKLGNEIKVDLDFLKSHTLQPKWFKILKVFILLGFLLGYYFLFGLVKTALFFACFVSLALVIHFTYRAKTKKYTQSWLDFVVEENNRGKPKRIGKFYYSAVIISAILSFVISQVLIR